MRRSASRWLGHWSRAGTAAARRAVRRAGRPHPPADAGPVGDLVARHRPAVLLVTHDVDEAVRLADRVLILNEGSFAVDVDIDLARPRDRNDPEALRYRAAFLAELGVGRDATHHPGRSTP